MVGGTNWSKYELTSYDSRADCVDLVQRWSDVYATVRPIWSWSVLFVSLDSSPSLVSRDLRRPLVILSLSLYLCDVVTTRTALPLIAATSTATFPATFAEVQSRRDRVPEPR